MKMVCLLLGGNIGDRLANMTKARQMIESLVGVVVKKSSLYETQAWGKMDVGDYLNQAVLCETNLSPWEVLNSIHLIENTLERVRIEKWGSRTMDIDIIFYGDEVINERDLVIPHPLMHERNFVLCPLIEIMPEFIHPIAKITIKQLLEDCMDCLTSYKLSETK